MTEKYAQAHVDGLANLIAFFAKFYDAMPDAQKKIADEVFITPVAGALHRWRLPITAVLRRDSTGVALLGRG